MLISFGIGGVAPPSSCATAAAHVLACELAANADFGIAPAIAAAMPKSAFAANAQAKTCAAAVARLLSGAAPSAPKLINTCYSLVAPDYGISIAGVYYPSSGQLAEVPGSGGVSPADASRATRAAEAVLAEAWFHTITGEVFG